MSRVIETARDYALSHPISIAASLVIVVPGTYMFFANKPPYTTSVIHEFVEKTDICNGKQVL